MLSEMYTLVLHTWIRCKDRWHLNELKRLSLRGVKPDFFAPDFQFQSLSRERQWISRIADYHDRMSRSLIRNVLKIRV